MRGDVKSMVCGALGNEQTRAGKTRAIPEIVSRRDPLEEARKRVRAQRRAAARIPILAEPGTARQDRETVRPEGVEKLVNS